MGQSGSKTHVHIHIDQPFYYAGDVVSGSAVLHIEEPMTFKSINIKVSGAEKCQWQETHHNGKHTTTETYKGKHAIFENKHPIMAAGTLNPGDYQWPFSFQLPHNVPSSFSYTSGDTRASIQYKVKADCDQAGLLKPDFKQTTTIRVLQRTQAAGPPGPLALTAEEPISFFCCFNKGKIGLRVDGGTNCLLPGESLALRPQVDNKSTTDVRAVEFYLRQKLKLTAQTMWGSSEKHFTSTFIHQRQVMQGFPNGAASSTSQYEAMLQLPQDLEASCHSQLIHSTYELEVCAKTGCCLRGVVVRQPISVLLSDPQPMQLPPAVVPPEGWAPLVYPAVQVALPAPDGYANYAPQPYQSPVAASAAAMMQPHLQQQQQQQQQQGVFELSPGSAVTYNTPYISANYGGGSGYPEPYTSLPAPPGAAMSVYH